MKTINLKTPYYDNCNFNLPWNEYPRPQLLRNSGNIQFLNQIVSIMFYIKVLFVFLFVLNQSYQMLIKNLKTMII